MTAFNAPGSASDVESSFLPHPAMDRMLDALVALSAELWAERERRAALEQVLARRGLLADTEIESRRCSESEQEQRKRDRDAYVRRVFGSMGQL
jgi:hypothetical protein